MNDFEEQRKKLVDSMVKSGVLKSEALKKAFLSVRREEFFLPNMRHLAYFDSAFPIGYGQTISQPSTIAIMLELLDVKPHNKVLEIGSGSGYVLALLAELAYKGKVFGIERIAELANRSKHLLAKLGYKNVSVICDDGSKGLANEAPFDRILISAACSEIPKQLVSQLANDAKLVAPVGSRFEQRIVLIEKKDGKLSTSYAPGYFVFVPLVKDK